VVVTEDASFLFGGSFKMKCVSPASGSTTTNYSCDVFRFLKTHKITILLRASPSQNFQFCRYICIIDVLFMDTLGIINLSSLQQESFILKNGLSIKHGEWGDTEDINLNRMGIP